MLNTKEVKILESIKTPICQQNVVDLTRDHCDEVDLVLDQIRRRHTREAIQKELELYVGPPIESTDKFKELDISVMNFIRIYRRVVLDDFYNGKSDGFSLHILTSLFGQWVDTNFFVFGDLHKQNRSIIRVFEDTVVETISRIAKKHPDKVIQGIHSSHHVSLVPVDESLDLFGNIRDIGVNLHLNDDTEVVS